MPALDRHSKLVGIFKVALPLVGLALMATLFLVARRVDPQTAIPYAKVDVEELLRDPRMTAPAYAGVTSDGSAIALKAKTARPAREDQEAGALDVTTVMDLPKGGSVQIKSAEAEIAEKAGELRLMGGVEVETSSGYQLIAPGMIVNLDQSGLASTGQGIRAEGPIGQITSDRFALIRADEAQNDSPPSLLVFSDRVKLLYVPKTAID